MFFDDKIFLPLLYSFIVYFHGHMFHLFRLLQYFCVGLHHFSIMCLILDPLVMVCYCVGWCWILCYCSLSLTCHFLLCLNWSWLIDILFKDCKDLGGQFLIVYLMIDCADSAFLECVIDGLMEYFNGLWVGEWNSLGGKRNFLFCSWYVLFSWYSFWKICPQVFYFFYRFIS